MVASLHRRFRRRHPVLTALVLMVKLCFTTSDFASFRRMHRVNY